MTVYDFACFVQNIRLLLFVKKEWLFPSKVCSWNNECVEQASVFLSEKR